MQTLGLDITSITYLSQILHISIQTKLKIIIKTQELPLAVTYWVVLVLDKYLHKIILWLCSGEVNTRTIVERTAYNVRSWSPLNAIFIKISF